MSNSPDHFMRCAILSAHPIGIEAWDIETLRGVFHLTPRPTVTFEEWVRRMSGEPDHTLDANDQFIAFARQNLESSEPPHGAPPQ